MRCAHMTSLPPQSRKIANAKRLEKAGRCDRPFACFFNELRTSYRGSFAKYNIATGNIHGAR
jgi:hypothetical protein